MVVLLPREDYAFRRLLDDLTVDYWQGLWRRFSDRDGTIVLPRFTIEYDVTLNDPLQALGMTDAFSRQRADFSQLWEKSPDVNVFIQQVRHKTFVQVNEEGTEAAGVTSVEIGVTSVGMQPPPPFNMVVDRPFVCAIVDETTGLILFVGAIMDPRA